MHRCNDRRAPAGAFPAPRPASPVRFPQALEVPPAVRVLGTAALLLAGPASAQTPRLLVSTGNDVPATATTPFCADGDVEAVGGSLGTHLSFGESHWLATTGFVPGDVDGFAFRPGAAPGSMASLAFSFLSDEGGVLDGDVVGVTPGGLQVLIPEASLAQGLGTPGAALDVDGLDFDDQGRLLFTLQNDLDGTSLGKVLDGDVLRLEANGTVTLVAAESVIDACFAIATGLGSAVGDVQGIDWVNGELWVAIQSPSSHDGGVLACGSNPRIVADEGMLDLGGAELDALSVLPVALPGCSVEPRRAPVGAGLQAEFHGRPNSTQLVLMAGATGHVAFPQAPGFGAWLLDPTDPWLNSFWIQPAPPLVYLDANGEYRTTYSLPPAAVHGTGWGGDSGWSFQMVDLGTLELSAPIRVEML